MHSNIYNSGLNLSDHLAITLDVNINLVIKLPVFKLLKLELNISGFVGTN